VLRAVWRAEGKALLETDEVLFRGAFRVKVPLAAVKAAEVAGDDLVVRFGNSGTGGNGVNGSEEEVAFELGAAVAQRWAKRILRPPTLLDKLGVKRGQRVLVVGRFDKEFLRALQEGGVDATATPRPENDMVFYEANAREDLARLAGLEQFMKRDGALWVVRPKGVVAITEREVMAAGKEAGLVDVKVARFSETHTAEKFVIPVVRR
jgi:hypothetical protein